jgi:hypothetical protein
VSHTWSLQFRGSEDPDDCKFGEAPEPIIVTRSSARAAISEGFDKWFATLPDGFRLRSVRLTARRIGTKK